MYLFGVEEPDCYGAIEFDTGKSIVFVERVPDSAKLWIVFHDKDWFLNRY